MICKRPTSRQPSTETGSGLDVVASIGATATLQLNSSTIASRYG